MVNSPPEDAVKTRAACNNSLLLPKFKKRAGQRAFSVIAPCLWNLLDAPMRNKSSLDEFKDTLKTYLFQGKLKTHLLFQ